MRVSNKKIEFDFNLTFQVLAKIMVKVNGKNLKTLFVGYLIFFFYIFVLNELREVPILLSHQYNKCRRFQMIIIELEDLEEIL